MAKRGRMSVEEQSFLDQYLDSKSDEDLARDLDRTVEFVAKYRKTKPFLNTTQEEDKIILKLHNLGSFFSK